MHIQGVSVFVSTVRCWRVAAVHSPPAVPRLPHVSHQTADALAFREHVSRLLWWCALAGGASSGLGATYPELRLKHFLYKTEGHAAAPMDLIPPPQAHPQAPEAASSKMGKAQPAAYSFDMATYMLLEPRSSSCMQSLGGVLEVNGRGRRGALARALGPVLGGLSLPLLRQRARLLTSPMQICASQHVPAARCISSQLRV